VNCSRDRKGIGSGRLQISDRPTDRDQRQGDRDRDQRLGERDRDQRLGDRVSQDREDGKSVFDRRRVDRDLEDGRIRFTRISDDAFSGRYSRDDGYRSNNYDRTDRDRRDDNQISKGRFDRERDIVGERVFERRKDGPLKGKVCSVLPFGIALLVQTRGVH